MDEPRIQTTIRISADLKRKLDQLSDENGYSQNWFIERAIAKAVKEAIAKSKSIK